MKRHEFYKSSTKRNTKRTASDLPTEMVSEIRISTELDITRELLWKVRSTHAFMQFLVQNGALNRMDAAPVEDEPESTTKRRVQTYVPRIMEIPPVIKTIFDDSYLEITDMQSWDDVCAPYKMNFDIVPGVMEEYVKMNGVLTMLPNGDKGVGCVQVIEATCQVDIPFIGYYVEQAILANLNSFYDTYPVHIQDFVKMAVHKYGDGTAHSLPNAVEKMCMEDNRRAASEELTAIKD